MFKSFNRTRLLSLLSVPLLLASVLFFQPSPTATAHEPLQQNACTLIHTVGGNTQVFVCPRNTRPVPGARPIFTFSDQTQLYVVVGAQPTATRTQPPAATPTRTQPSATQVPPASPTAGTGNIAPYPSAPLCAAHDNRAYHSLWNSAQGCHYDHQHGDEPHALYDLLCTDIYTKMGGEISYPWQTFSAAGLENDLKHAGYFWHVRRDMPCDTSPCISAFRTLVHQHASGRDATVRYHSYVFEAVTSDGGYILFGGWADFGDLHSPEGHIVINELGNVDSNNQSSDAPGRHKQHSPSGSPQIIWYGASQQVIDQNHPRGFITLSTSIHDVWDYTNPADPSSFTDYVCFGNPRCTANATTLRPHLIGISMVNMWNGLIDPDQNGRADWSGYADRYGRLLPSTCPAYNVDCAPVIFRNLRTGQNYSSANSHTAASYRDYDIYFNGQTSGWSQPVP